MSDSGFWKNIVGQDPFAKNGIKLWWMKVHSLCKTLYVILLFGFGILSTIKRPTCLPADKNETFNAPSQLEAAFISQVCASKISWYDNLETICPLIICLIFMAETVSLGITRINLIDPLSLFGKAFKLFEKSNLSLEDFKRYISEPNFWLKHSEECYIARRIASLLHDCSLHRVEGCFMVREWYMFIIFTGNTLALVFVMLLGSQLFLDNPVFECNFSDYQDVVWSSNISSEFMCTQPWTGRDYSIIVFYFCILAVDCLSLFLAVTNVFYYRIVSPNTALLLRHLWADGRTEPEKEFKFFVDIAFSENYRKLMKKNLELVGTDADLQFTQMIEVLVDVTNCNRKPDLRALIENRRWDWIIHLLQIFPQPFDDLTSLQLIDTSLLDSETTYPGMGSELAPFLCPPKKREVEGCSILFYALNKESGDTKFHMRGAKCILECTKDQERIVCYNGGRVSAKDFVEMQYASDPQYPERVKDLLLEYIGN